jgi:hypothetical protein
MRSERHAPPDWLRNGLDPVALARFFLHPRVRAVLAWAALLTASASVFYSAWRAYYAPDKPGQTVGYTFVDFAGQWLGHTVGYTFVDFAGQWLMGRMLVRDEGRWLYNKEHLRAALEDAYGRDDGDDVAKQFIETDDHRASGPLYPPIQALFMYPLGLMPPLLAYRTAQVVNFSLTFVIGFLVWRLTRGRVWAVVASAVVMAFPGYNGAICLVQNPLLSLTLLVLGWLLASRGRPWLGGAVWGLLAFKPVWAAAFFLVPLLSRRWRFCAAMLLTGLGLAALTLPFVGWQTWLDWAALGQAASADYARFENWIFISRDLQGIPRRWFFSFDHGFTTDPEQPLANKLAWGLWLGVFALTTCVALWRWRLPSMANARPSLIVNELVSALARWRRPAGLDGPPTAFLMLGGWLSCLHFMYYDVMLAALPVCLLFTQPRRYLEPVYLRPPGPRGGWLWNDAAATLASLLIIMGQIAAAYDPGYRWPPLDTFCLLALWAWCGWRWLRQPETEHQESSRNAGEAGPHAVHLWPAKEI